MQKQKQTLCVSKALYLPDGADSDNGGKSSSKFVTSKGVPSIHAGYNLNSFQANKLQVWIVETIVR